MKKQKQKQEKIWILVRLGNETLPFMVEILGTYGSCEAAEHAHQPAPLVVVEAIRPPAERDRRAEQRVRPAARAVGAGHAGQLRHHPAADRHDSVLALKPF